MEIYPKRLDLIIQDYYLPDRRKTLRENTIGGYISIIDNHILPRFGFYDIENISYDEVQSWIDTFPSRGSAENALKMLRQIINWYQKKTRKKFDLPTNGVELPKKQGYKMETLSGKQVKVLLKHLRGHPMEPVVICQVTMGLRRAEAFGLKWEDINLENGEVWVHRSRQFINGRIVDLPPKTEKSNRVCVLPKKHLRRMRKIAKQFKKDDYIYDKSPDVGALELKNYCKENFLPWVSMKNFRHTFATLALNEGVDISQIALYLGHTEITTAYNHYIREIPQTKINISKKMGKVLR